MKKIMEKIAEEAFIDELQKIAGSSYKTTPDTMSKSNRMSLGKSYDTKNQLGSAMYNYAAGFSGQRMSPSDSTKYVNNFNNTTGKTLHKVNPKRIIK